MHVPIHQPRHHSATCGVEHVVGILLGRVKRGNLAVRDQDAFDRKHGTGEVASEELADILDKYGHFVACSQPLRRSPAAAI